MLGAELARASGIDVGTYVTDAILRPLGMTSTDATGSPAKGFSSTVEDLARFAHEMLRPTLVTQETAAEATRVQFADLGGILPGVGRFSPNPWGLGPEIRDGKQPHWTGTTNSPATFGHFGGSGTFLWVDPAIGHACVMLSDREFGEWALTHWPALSDAVVAELGGGA
jgi:CubicO group peptidase (beta-lactamase class C family)